MGVEVNKRTKPKTIRYYNAAIKITMVGEYINVPTRLWWFRTIVGKIDPYFNYLSLDDMDHEELKQILDEKEKFKSYYINIRNKNGRIKCGFRAAFEIEPEIF